MSKKIIKASWDENIDEYTKKDFWVDAVEVIVVVILLFAVVAIIIG